ncbi:MAG TPA: histidine phosphatase family protein [Actinomycetota bacterium]
MVGVGTLELWLVRHGETDWSTARRFCGWSDPPLNGRGRAQARAVAESLAGTSFDTVVSSSSARAIETARLAYGEPVTDDRLRELDFGELEGLTWDECSPDMRAQLADYHAFVAPKGEAVRDLMTRVTSALRELGAGRHLVVSHGGVIYGIGALAGIDDYPAPGSLRRVAITLDRGAEVLTPESIRAL